jgi:hypothetical protein
LTTVVVAVGKRHTAVELARLSKAEKAEDAVVAAAFRAQADALEIEALAKRRLADEYDAAQERGEIASPKGGGERSGRERSQAKATAADVGLSRKEIHEARQIRDAEKRDPGVVRRTVDAGVAADQSRRAIASNIASFLACRKSW